MKENHMLDKINPLSSKGERKPKFQAYKNKSDSDYHWRLVAANGEELALSEACRTKDGAMKGFAALKCAADDAEIVELDQAPTRERSSK